MAGRRHSKGRPTRSEARDARMAARLAAATTPSNRAAAAMDALRMAAAHSPERGAAALEDAVSYLGGLTRWVRAGGDAA
jgi:hypothetical protein